MTLFGLSDREILIKIVDSIRKRLCYNSNDLDDVSDSSF